MKLLFENWRRYLNEQGEYTMPPGHEEPDYGPNPPWDDETHPHNKYYLKEGDTVVWLGSEFNELQVDLLRFGAHRFLKAYGDRMPKDPTKSRHWNRRKNENDIKKLQHVLAKKLAELPRVPIRFMTVREPPKPKPKSVTIGPGRRDSW